MDYCQWGGEYLALAERMKEHLKPLKAELKTLRGEDQLLLFRRVAMMNQMRLECLRTGRELVERGKQYAEHAAQS